MSESVCSAAPWLQAALSDACQTIWNRRNTCMWTMIWLVRQVQNCARQVLKSFGPISGCPSSEDKKKIYKRIRTHLYTCLRLLENIELTKKHSHVGDRQAFKNKYIWFTKFTLPGVPMAWSNGTVMNWPKPLHDIHPWTVIEAAWLDGCGSTRSTEWQHRVSRRWGRLARWMWKHHRAISRRWKFHMHTGCKNLHRPVWPNINQF